MQYLQPEALSCAIPRHPCLIREMLDQTYPAGSYLPSLPQLAGTYGVGVNMVRRTLELLAVWAWSAPATEREPWSASSRGNGSESLEIRDGFRLYWESPQFLALTIRPVARCALRARRRRRQRS